MNLPSSEIASRYPVTPRSKVKRMPKRGSPERAQVYAILDAHFLCHIGYVIDGQPYVTPTAYWREGRKLYWHGAAATAFLIGRPYMLSDVSIARTTASWRCFAASAGMTAMPLTGLPFSITWTFAALRPGSWARA